MKVTMVIAVVAGLLVMFFCDPVTEAKVFLSAMTGLSWGFSLLYAARSNWRATQAGKALMYTSAALAMLGTQVLTVWWFGDYPFRDDVRNATLILLILTLLYRIIVLLRFQNLDRQRDRHQERRGF